MTNNSQEERMHGAKLIISRLGKLAEEAGISINDPIWNKKQGIDNRENHTLEIPLEHGEVISAEFSREELEDYPGKFGTGKTDSKLRGLISELLTKIVEK